MSVTKPTVGSNSGTWGATLNAALDTLDAGKADAAHALYVVPYQTTVPVRPAYAGPVVIQIPEAQKGNVTFTGSTSGGGGLVNGLDFVWTS